MCFHSNKGWGATEAGGLVGGGGEAGRGLGCVSAAMHDSIIFTFFLVNSWVWGEIEYWLEKKYILKHIQNGLIVTDTIRFHCFWSLQHKCPFIAMRQKHIKAEVYISQRTWEKIHQNMNVNKISISYDALNYLKKEWSLGFKLMQSICNTQSQVTSMTKRLSKRPIRYNFCMTQ